MRTAVIAAGICLSLVGSCFAQTSSTPVTRIETQIPPQALESALKQFTKLDHIQVMYLDAAVDKVRTPGASGYLTSYETLTQLLNGTGLTYRFVDNTEVSILPVGSTGSTPVKRAIKGAAEVQSTNPSEHLRHAASKDMDPPKEPDPQSQSDTPVDASKSPHGRTLKEVLVTGTHIAGVGSIASPVITYSREYLSASGASDIGEAIQQLPENLSDATEMTQESVPAGPGNALSDKVGAVGIDIHGLGPQSTLVLINGHRIASGNDEGNFTDVSLVPLGGIDHIDIVEDSAGAIYGSDAVGGVVNIVMAPKLTGSETLVRYGSVTEGSRTETTFSQTAGVSWRNGSAVMSYDYGDERPLPAIDRTFSDGAPSPFSLLPEQVSHSAYGSVTQVLPSDVTLTGFVLYGHRSIEDSYYFGLSPADSVLDAGTVNTYTLDVDVRKPMGSWGVATGSIEYSSNDSRHLAFISSQTTTPGAYIPYGNDDGHSTIESAELGFSGHLATFENHAVHYAIGAQVRKEDLSYANYLGGSNFRPSRTIAAEYVELLVPLGRHVMVTAAGRNDRYSDVGSTTDPKVGIEWKPNDDVEVGATYSTAFLAPPLYDLNPIPSGGEYVRLVDPLKVGPCRPADPLPQAGCTPVLALAGGNADLKPQTAKTETARIALHPSRAPGLRASLSFYDIKYYNLINELYAYESAAYALINQGAFGSLVQRNIPNQVIQEIAQTVPTGEFYNYGNVNSNTVTTFVDERSSNLSRLSTRGLDFDVSYNGHMQGASVLSELTGVRILQYRTQFQTATSPLDVLNAAFNPLSLKLREHESVAVGHISASMFLNYTGGYTNPYVTPPARVSSWLTIDAQAAYAIPLGGGDRSASVIIGCLNVADRNPPYVDNTRFPINFDGANATPLGRFVYAEMRLSL